MLFEGVIKKSTGSWYHILTAEGKLVQAKIKGKFRLDERKNTNPIAVGDRVKFSIEDKTGTGIIEELLPRRSYIIRKSNNLSKQEHVIAANPDQVLIVATLVYPRTSQGFIDRILVTAEAYEIPAIIVFNKADICTDEMKEMLEEFYRIYIPLGYRCMSISVKENYNIDKLEELLSGKTTLVTGHSGVGKSSLLNILIPGLNVKTSGLSNSSLKGKHTTTFAEMHAMDKNSYLIDTPGIKDFGIIDIGQEELGHYFPEMRELLGKCKFNNCLHVNEPGCAVMQAMEEGKISASRYSSYLSMLNEEDTHH